MPDDPALKTVPDRLRRAETRLAMLEDRVEVISGRRTTWLPGTSASNMTGRQREILVVALALVAYLLARKAITAAAGAHQMA